MSSHYTRDEIVKDHFLFVSYKHDAGDVVVQGVLDYLFEQGVRFWYDADLGMGDNWIKIAEGLINNENCRGVIFFNSRGSFTSKPVHFEREFTIRKIKECEKKGIPFFVFPVSIGKPSTLRLIKSVFEVLPDDDHVIEENFSLDFLKGIAELFESSNIYCYADPDNAEAYKKSIYQKISQSLPDVIDQDAVRMKMLRESGGQGRDALTVSLGIGKDRLATAVPSSLCQKDRVVVLHNNTYVIQNGRAYTGRKLLWRVLYCEDDTFALISEDVVELRGGGKELQEWLTGTFLSSAFTAEERDMITDVRLLSPKDLEKIKTADQLTFDASPGNPEGHWWIGVMAHGALQKVIKKDGSVFSAGYNIRTKKSGVRPVITLSKDALLRLVEHI